MGLSSRNGNSLRRHASARKRLVAVGAFLCVATAVPCSMAPAVAQTATVVPAAALQPTGAEELAPLLPPSVYFRGKLATLQARNAGGAKLGDRVVLWAALVDSSGYTSSLSEKYQAYLVAEVPISLSGSRLAPGAYGMGVVDGRLIVMDMGGRTVAEAPAKQDDDLKRPRPLQVIGGGRDGVRLYFGRRFMTVDAAP